MKEIWFWISKELAELAIVAIVILGAVVCYGVGYLIDTIQIRTKKKKQDKEGVE